MRLILAARLACLFAGLAVGVAGCGSASSPSAGVTDGHRFRHVLHGRTDVPAGVLLVVGGCHPHECADATGRPAAGR